MEKTNKPKNTKNLLKHKLLLSYNLLPFLMQKEILEVGLVNKCFFEIFKIYALSWKNEFALLAEIYNLDYKKIDVTRYHAVKNLTIYPFKDTPNNYLGFNEEGNSIISSFYSGPHTDNTSYFLSNYNCNSKYKLPTLYLKYVWWFDIRIHFKRVPKGIYGLYIYHGCKNEADLESLYFKVFANEDSSTHFYEHENYMNEEMRNNIKEKIQNNDNSTVEYFVTVLDFTKVESDFQFLSPYINIGNIDCSYTKSKWFCSGAILKEIVVNKK